MLSSNATVGDASAARSWVEKSSLSETDKRALLLFIDRFPALTFYHDGPERLDFIEERQQVTLPRWLRKMTGTLTYVMPDHYVWTQFNHFSTPGLDRAELRDDWYRLNALGNPSDEEQELLDRMRGIHPYPIGGSEIAGNSTLAINLADLTDERIYEYSPEFLQDEASDGNPLEEVVRPLFASYADMFAHIDTLKMVPKSAMDMVDPEDWPPPTIVEALG